MQDEWINKTWLTHRLEWYSVLMHAVTEMNLESMLCELRSKRTNVWFYIQRSSSQRVEWWLPGAEGRGVRSYCSLIRASVWKDRQVLEMDTNEVCATEWKYLMPLKCILQNYQDRKFYIDFITKKYKTRRLFSSKSKNCTKYQNPPQKQENNHKEMLDFISAVSPAMRK